MAGYTEIRIEGQTVGLRFGLAALKIAAQKNAIKIIDGVMETPDTIGSARYLHAAYLDNCYVKEIPADIPFEKFVEWMEEQELTGGTEAARISQVITDSSYVKPKAEAKEDDKKKVKRKSTGTK